MKIRDVARTAADFIKLISSRAIFVLIRPLGLALELVLPKKAHKASARSSSSGSSSISDYQREACMIELNGTISLLKYKNPSVRSLIWDFKYYLKPYALNLCTDIMYDELVADMSDRVAMIPFHGSTTCLVIHCPSSTFFKGEKAFDHMKELLTKAERYLNPDAPFFTACIHAILPNRGEKAQHLGTRDERLKWARERFSLSEEFIKFVRTRHLGARTPPSHIYCIDDVTTTGASLRAIEELVRTQTGLTVRSIALSH